MRQRNYIFRGGTHTYACIFYTYVTMDEYEGRPLAEGWRWCWKETESIPIGPLWYSEATMPAIGCRSTKPLNDPPRRTVVLRPLYFNLGNPPYTPSSPSTHASIPDAKLPHFSVLTAGRCIDDRARMVMQSRVIFDVSYASIDDLSSPDILMEFL